MALFIGQLAFSDAGSLGVAKLAVLVASAIAGILGLVLGWLALPRQLPEGAIFSVDLAERSTDQ
jgi:Na+/H+ antiporter NhaA